MSRVGKEKLSLKRRALFRFGSPVIGIFAFFLPFREPSRIARASNGSPEALTLFDALRAAFGTELQSENRLGVIGSASGILVAVSLIFALAYFQNLKSRRSKTIVAAAAGFILVSSLLSTLSFTMIFERFIPFGSSYDYGHEPVLSSLFLILALLIMGINAAFRIAKS